MLKVLAAGEQMFLSTDPAEPGEGVVTLLDGQRVCYHTVMTVTSENQLQAVAQRVPQVRQHLDYYRAVAGIPPPVG